MGMFSAFSADVPAVSVSSSTGNERESVTVTLPAPYWPKDALLPKGTRDFYGILCIVKIYKLWKSTNTCGCTCLFWRQISFLFTLLWISCITFLNVPCCVSDTAVLAMWRDKHWYHGHVLSCSSVSVAGRERQRYTVQFEDGNTKKVKVDEIVVCELPAIGQVCYAAIEVRYLKKYRIKSTLYILSGCFHF